MTSLNSTPRTATPVRADVAQRDTDHSERNAAKLHASDVNAVQRTRIDVTPPRRRSLKSTTQPNTMSMRRTQSQQDVSSLKSTPSQHKASRTLISRHVTPRKSTPRNRMSLSSTPQNTTPSKSTPQPTAPSRQAQRRVSDRSPEVTQCSTGGASPHRPAPETDAEFYMRMRHLHKSPSKRTFRCDKCSETFSTANLLEWHYGWEHTPYRSAVAGLRRGQPRGVRQECFVCGAFSTDLLSHVKKHNTLHERLFLPDAPATGETGSRSDASVKTPPSLKRERHASLDDPDFVPKAEGKPKGTPHHEAAREGRSKGEKRKSRSEECCCCGGMFPDVDALVAHMSENIEMETEALLAKDMGTEKGAKRLKRLCSNRERLKESETGTGKKKKTVTKASAKRSPTPEKVKPINEGERDCSPPSVEVFLTPEGRRFRCSLCGRHWSREHWFHMHGCARLGGNTPSQGVNLKKQRETQAETPEEFWTAEGRRFRCTVCGRHWKHKKNHKSHRCGPARHTDTAMLDERRRIVTTRDGEKRHQCRLCLKSWTSVTEMKKHNCANSRCDMCQQTFLSDRELMEHWAWHRRPHECSACAKRFLCAGRLRTHMRRHSGEKPEVCVVCSLSFRRVRTLKRHLLEKHGRIAPEEVEKLKLQAPKRSG